jgi:hypothetical protein
MKNYLVRAIKSFNDYDGSDVKDANNPYTPREANKSEWKVTKERYEFLKQNNAVVLLGIDKVEEPKEEKKETKKKTAKK